MIVDGKKACDWCGRKFMKNNFVEYSDGTCYHHNCVKSVGGRTDLGRNVFGGKRL